VDVAVDAVVVAMIVYAVAAEWMLSIQLYSLDVEDVAAEHVAVHVHVTVLMVGVLVLIMVSILMMMIVVVQVVAAVRYDCY
jgi:hypothetical protein